MSFTLIVTDQNLSNPHQWAYKKDYKTFKQATGTMILLVYVGSMVI